MNIWALRKKALMQNAEPLLSQTASQPAAPVKASPPPAELPERIGLNELFSMTDTEIRQLSPRNSFSKLMVSHLHQECDQAQVVVNAGADNFDAERISKYISVERAAVRESVGLNELLTMDAEAVDQLFS